MAHVLQSRMSICLPTQRSTRKTVHVSDGERPHSSSVFPQSSEPMTSSKRFYSQARQALIEHISCGRLNNPSTGWCARRRLSRKSWSRLEDFDEATDFACSKARNLPTDGSSFCLKRLIAQKLARPGNSPRQCAGTD